MRLLALVLSAASLPLSATPLLAADRLTWPVQIGEWVVVDRNEDGWLYKGSHAIRTEKRDGVYQLVGPSIEWILSADLKRCERKVVGVVDAASSDREEAEQIARSRCERWLKAINPKAGSSKNVPP